MKHVLTSLVIKCNMYMYLFDLMNTNLPPNRNIHFLNKRVQLDESMIVVTEKRQQHTEQTLQDMYTCTPIKTIHTLDYILQITNTY